MPQRTESVVSENVVLEPLSLHARFCGQPRVIDSVDADVDRGEVLRYVGYPAGKTPGTRLQGLIDHWTDAAAKRAKPRAVFVVLPIQQIDRRSLHVQANQEVVKFKGAIGEFLGPSRLVAAFIADIKENGKEIIDSVSHSPFIRSM